MSKDESLEFQIDDDSIIKSSNYEKLLGFKIHSKLRF